MLAACDQDIDIATLPASSPAALPAAVVVADDVIFGEWEGAVSVGNTNRSYFEQRYAISFQSVDDGTASYSHWFTRGEDEKEDSLTDLSYTYTFDGSNILMAPAAEAALEGADTLHALCCGEKQMILYSHLGGDTICTLTRVSDPRPVFTSVDRTLPAVGDTVTISGRNLQFVTNVYLPTADGDMEVEPVSQGSKTIKLVVPQADYVAGSIRLRASGANLSTYSPAYMFAYNCVFFHNFISTSTKPYTGTEFEYSISSMGTLKSNVAALSSSNLPAGHSLSMFTGFNNPDSLLSFHGNTPAAWEAQTSGHDNKKGYLRFCMGDRLQYALDHCDGLYTAQTSSQDLALQMDIFVYSDGLPQWNTGYLSWRINKNNSWNSSMVANVAMWQNDEPADFSSGWKTMTIPLSEFSVTSTQSGKTLGALISTSMMESLLCLENTELDELHTAHSLEAFQFNVANIRLVPYKAPANTTEE